MIALRTADGDLLGALVECEEMAKAGALGTWTPSDGDRMTLVRLKEHWHRAYLLRMVAQTLTGAERQAFIGYAERARQDYAALAAPLGALGDSIAVLDAYFAFCDGARARMREAALRVKVAEDDDIEDLYLVQLALDGAGDSDAAAAVRGGAPRALGPGGESARAVLVERVEFAVGALPARSEGAISVATRAADVRRRCGRCPTQLRTCASIRSSRSCAPSCPFVPSEGASPA